MNAKDAHADNRSRANEAKLLQSLKLHLQSTGTCIGMRNVPAADGLEEEARSNVNNRHGHRVDGPRASPALCGRPSASVSFAAKNLNFIGTLALCPTTASGALEGSSLNLTVHYHSSGYMFVDCTHY